MLLFFLYSSLSCRISMTRATLKSPISILLVVPNVLVFVFFSGTSHASVPRGGTRENKVFILFIHEEFEIHLTLKGSMPSHQHSTFLPLTSCYLLNYGLIVCLMLILRIRNRASIHLHVINQEEKEKTSFLNSQNIFTVEMEKKPDILNLFNLLPSLNPSP